MVGLVKNTLYKTVWGVKVRVERIRRSSHRYRDNVKQQTIDLHRRRYQFSVLMPNLLVLGQTPVIPNEDLTDNENKDL